MKKSPPKKYRSYYICGCHPIDKTWRSHLADIEKIRDKADDLDNVAASLALTILLAEHRLVEMEGETE